MDILQDIIYYSHCIDLWREAMQEKHSKMQDTFLNAIRQDKVFVTVFFGQWDKVTRCHNVV